MLYGLGDQPSTLPYRIYNEGAALIGRMEDLHVLGCLWLLRM